MARASQVEQRARALCVELARVAGVKPMQWRTVEPIAAALGATADAIAFAVERDWLLTEGEPPHSVCLTDGRPDHGATAGDVEALTDMTKQRTRRYSIEIKDDTGKTVIFTAADWTAEQARLAVSQIMRLAGLPDDNCLAAPKRGGD